MTNFDWFDKLQLKTIQLVPVRSEHADYIYSLRIDPLYNTHLSPPPASAEAQRAWIERYVQREQQGEEFYFVIERLDKVACGTVRLYDFRGPSFCWGSWILDHNKSRYAAIESALLVYRIGFEHLGFDESHFDVRRENRKVISFHKKMGAITTEIDDDNEYMRLPKEVFYEKQRDIIDFLGRSAD